MAIIQNIKNLLKEYENTVAEMQGVSPEEWKKAPLPQRIAGDIGTMPYAGLLSGASRLTGLLTGEEAPATGTIPEMEKWLGAPATDVESYARPERTPVSDFFGNAPEVQPMINTRGGLAAQRAADIGLMVYGANQLYKAAESSWGINKLNKAVEGVNKHLTDFVDDALYKLSYFNPSITKDNVVEILGRPNAQGVSMMDVERAKAINNFFRPMGAIDTKLAGQVDMYAGLPIPFRGRPNQWMQPIHTNDQIKSFVQAMGLIVSQDNMERWGAVMGGLANLDKVSIQEIAKKAEVPEKMVHEAAQQFKIMHGANTGVQAPEGKFGWNPQEIIDASMNRRAEAMMPSPASPMTPPPSPPNQFVASAEVNPPSPEVNPARHRIITNKDEIMRIADQKGIVRMFGGMLPEAVEAVVRNINITPEGLIREIFGHDNPNMVDKARNLINIMLYEGNRPPATVPAGVAGQTAAIGQQPSTNVVNQIAAPAQQAPDMAERNALADKIARHTNIRLGLRPIAENKAKMANIIRHIFEGRNNDEIINLVWPVPSSQRGVWTWGDRFINQIRNGLVREGRGAPAPLNPQQVIQQMGAAVAQGPKTGDKVRIIRTGGAWLHGMHTGDIATVRGVRSEGSGGLTVDFNGAHWLVPTNEVEVVAGGVAPVHATVNFNPKVGDKIRILAKNADPRHAFNIGEEGIVVDNPLNSNRVVQVQIGPKLQWVAKEDMGLIQAGPGPRPAVNAQPNPVIQVAARLPKVLKAKLDKLTKRISPDTEFTPAQKTYWAEARKRFIQWASGGRGANFTGTSTATLKSITGKKYHILDILQHGIVKRTSQIGGNHCFEAQKITYNDKVSGKNVAGYWKPSNDKNSSSAVVSYLVSELLGFNILSPTTHLNIGGTKGCISQEIANADNCADNKHGVDKTAAIKTPSGRDSAIKCMLHSWLVDHWDAKERNSMVQGKPGEDIKFWLIDQDLAFSGQSCHWGDNFAKLFRDIGKKDLEAPDDVKKMCKKLRMRNFRQSLVDLAKTIPGVRADAIRRFEEHLNDLATKTWITYDNGRNDSLIRIKVR